MVSRVVKPADCTFAVAIPTTEPAFRGALCRLAAADFVAQCPVWAKYRHDVVEPFVKTVPSFATLGVNVRTDVSFTDFRNLLGTRPRVVTLFAHWTNEGVEFGTVITPSRKLSL